jgi:hypothetical protein
MRSLADLTMCSDEHKQVNAMDLESILTSVPPEEWTTKQTVVFDWFDGPREGVALLETPACEFAFRLFAERHNGDDLDDRLFQVAELPAGSVMKILGAVAPLGRPANRVWAPVWRFATEEERQRADREIDSVLTKQRDTGIVIYTRDMIHFRGCWEVDGFVTQGGDWFVKLGV